MSEEGYCDGWRVDYCTSGRTRWMPTKKWQGISWLCDRHYQLWKENDERSTRTSRQVGENV